MDVTARKPLKRLWRLVALTVIIVIVLINCFPIYWMALTSFRPETEIISKIPRILPDGAMTLKNYRNIFSGFSGEVQITQSAFIFIRNSIIVATISTFLTLLLASPAAYALVRLKFPGRELAASSVLLCYLVPPLALIVPIFILCVKFNLQNSLIGLTIIETIFNIPVCLWLLRGYFVKMPLEVEESALVDGCRRLQVISKIILPMALPGMTVVALVCFLNAWNSYLFPLILIRSDLVKTAPVGLSIYLNEQIGMVWGEMMAAGTVIAIPIIIIFLLIQRNLIGGITVGAIKG